MTPSTVLIVIDLLNDFFERSPVLGSQRARLVAATNSLARGMRAAGVPVFWVRQEFAPDLSDAYQRDHETIVAADCVASHDPEHHEITVRYLDGKITRFLSNDEIFALLGEG